MRKRRIGLLIDTLIGGGAERIVLNFAETFSKFGHEVHIILIKNLIEHDVNRDLYTIHSLSETGKLSKNKFINKNKLSKLLREKVNEIESDGKKFDMFISNAEDMDLLAKKVKLKNYFIRYRNSMYVYYKSKLGTTKGFKRFRRKLKFKNQFKNRYNNQKIITVSKALIEEITVKMGIKPKLIKNIYNPFDFDTIRTKANDTNEKIPNKKYIIYVAKFENRKNQKLLIKAYKKANIDIPLVLMGNVHTDSDKNYYAELQELIKELDIEDKVIFPGFQKNPYPWINTKIVSTDCPTGPSEVLVDELSEFLSPINDIERLSQNIKKALNSYPNIDDKYIEKFKAEYSIFQYLDLLDN